MAVGVISPGWKPDKQKKPEKDALDMIAQGLQIAQAAYGIYADSEKLDLAKKSQGAPLQSKKEPEDALTQKDLAGFYEKGWTPAKEAEEGAVNFPVRGGTTAWLKGPQAKPEKAAADFTASPQEYADDSGKVRLGIFQTNKATGASQLIRNPNDPLAAKQPEVPGTNIKAPTEGQANFAAFGKRMVAASQTADAIEKAGYNPTAASSLLTKAPMGLGNLAMSKEAQSYETNKLDFVTAALRKESGAQIGKDEFALADRKYFPQIGDTPETIAFKSELRRRDAADFLALGGSAISAVSPQQQIAAQPTFGQRMGMEAGAAPAPRPRPSFNVDRFLQEP